MNISTLGPKFFVILYLSVILVPISGAADMMATQLLYLQSVNILSALFLIFNFGYVDFKKSVYKISSQTPVFLYLCFILWSSISISKAINLPEAFRTLSDLINYFTAFIFLIFNLNLIDDKKNFIINTFLVILFIEVAAIMLLFALEIESNNFDLSIRNSNYKGLTGNLNIAAFSIVLKLPLLIYKVLISKRYNLIYYLLFLISSFVVIYLHKTRAAILTVGLIIISLLFNIVYEKLKSKTLNSKLIYFVILGVSIFIVERPLNQILGSNDSTIRRIQAIGTEQDGSSAERLRYYKQAFSTMLKNPILGIGLGNWELESIKTDSENIRGYIVPYHAHNDFLELGAETGLIGALLYFSILIIVTLKLLLKFIYQNSLESNFYYFIAVSIGVFFSDMMFNFPFARPIQHVNYLALLSIAILELNNPFRIKLFKRIYFKKFLGLNLFLVFILSPAVLYSSYKVYNAYTQHYFLLGQFNYNKYTQDVETVLQYEDNYPNILPTTIPVNTLKGLFYVKKNEDYKSAVPYFKKGMTDNPYLMLSETMLGFSYLMLDKKDSALIHTKNAFEKMPNNPIHFAHYIITLSSLKDTLAIKDARNKITKINDEVIDQLYYQSMAQILDKDNSKIALEKLNQNILDTDNDKLKGSIYILEFGKDVVMKAATFHEQGKLYFEEKDFENAAISFEKASELNPLEIPYLENAINAYIQLGNNQKALELCNRALNLQNGNKPKIRYMKALVLLDMGQNDEACILLKTLINTPLKVSNQFLKQFCE